MCFFNIYLALYLTKTLTTLSSIIESQRVTLFIVALINTIAILRSILEVMIMHVEPTLTSQEAASHEGLRYVTDAKPGFTRKRRGKSFSFYDQQGRPLTDVDVIARIKSIGIPPAYEEVWISPWANGHIQAVGLDARGRKQYRYHTKWRSVRDESKFDHILHFGEALPVIRRALAKDMKDTALSRRKISATVISLLDKTLIRVGNAEYAKTNESYGLTTLRRKHVDVTGDNIKFHFTGKSGKAWNLSLKDHRIAATIKRCSHLPGHDLFKYVADDGTTHEISSSDVNGYLKEVTQQDFTAKDFRTWSGTVLAATALIEYLKYDTLAEAKKNVVQAIDHVAKQLGNTPSICRKCYVHPEILSAYVTGDLAKMIKGQIEEKFRVGSKVMSSEEVMVLAFLLKRLKTKKSRKN